MKQKRWLYILFVVIPLIGFLPFLLNIDKNFGRDWTSLFTSMSFVNRSIILHYKMLPIHNPWVCGGRDLLSNPQSHILAPSLLLDALFYPQWSNVLELFIYAIVGSWGMFSLLSFLGLTTASSVLGMILFTLCSWLALHFSEGHITYSMMQLLPAILCFSLKKQTPKNRFIVGVLLAACLLEGAIQPFVFGLFIIACAGLSRVDWKSREARGWLWIVFFLLLFNGKLQATLLSVAGLVLLVRHWNRWYRKGDIWAVMPPLLVGLSKIIPVLIVFHDKRPMFDSHILRPTILFYAFFYPFQSLTIPGLKVPPPDWFHEIGCYLGWIGLPMILYSVWRYPDYRKKNAIFLWLFVVWLWIGAGFGYPFNPWSLMQKVKLINQAHIQSRTFLIMFIFYLILVMRALERFRSKPVIYGFLFALLLAETTFVHFHITSQFFTLGGEALGRGNLIRNTTIEKTIPWGEQPDIYFSNTSSVRCYDRAVLPTDVLSSDDPRFRGQIFVDKAAGKADLLSVIPATIRFRYHLREPGEIVFNTNRLWGWKSSDSDVIVMPGKPDSLLRVSAPPGEREVTLRYRPNFLYPVLVIYIVGMIWTAARLYRIAIKKD